MPGHITPKSPPLSEQTAKRKVIKIFEIIDSIRLLDEEKAKRIGAELNGLSPDNRARVLFISKNNARRTVIHTAIARNQPILIAILRGNLDTVKWTNVLKAQDDYDQTAVHAAAFQNKPDAIIALRGDLNADQWANVLKVKNRDSRTAVHRAAFNNNPAIITAMLNGLNADQIEDLVFNEDYGAATQLKNNQKAIEALIQGINDITPLQDQEKERIIQKIYDSPTDKMILTVELGGALGMVFSETVGAPPRNQSGTGFRTATALISGKNNTDHPTDARGNSLQNNVNSTSPSPGHR